MSLIRSFVIGMKESPKWLVTKGRIEEAMAAINSISKKNGSDYVMDIDQFSAIPAQSTQKTHWRQDLATLRSFIVSAEKLRLLICLVLLWILVGIACVIPPVSINYRLLTATATQPTHSSSLTTSKLMARIWGMAATTRPIATGRFQLL